MSTPNEVISLKTTFLDGTGGEAELFHMQQKDAEGHLLTNPPALSASSNQPQYVQAFTHTADPSITEGDVDIRSVGPAPANITQAIVTITDGRAVNGVPVSYVVQVNITAAPDLSSISPSAKDPVRTLP